MMEPGSPEAGAPKRGDHVAAAGAPKRGDHVAVRTCVGCRRRARQDDLVRIVRRPDGTVQAGRTLPGRGAWLCAGSPPCLERAAKRKALSRALRAPIDADAVLAAGWDGLFR